MSAIKCFLNVQLPDNLEIEQGGVIYTDGHLHSMGGDRRDDQYAGEG